MIGPEGVEAVAPADLFPFLVGAAVVAYAGFVNGHPELASLAVISGSKPKRSSSILIFCYDLPPEHLVAGLHVSDVDI